MADQTALQVINDIIDNLAGEHVEIPKTMVPALLLLAEYISDLSGTITEDIGDAVEAWMDEHPEEVTTVRDYSLDSDKFVPGLFQQVTSEDIQEMIEGQVS